MPCQIWRFWTATRNITELCTYLTKVKLILLLEFYPSPQLKVFSTSGELKRTTKQTVVHKHMHYVVWCVVTMGGVLIKSSFEKHTKNWIFNNSAVNTSILRCKPHFKGFWILQFYSGTLLCVLHLMCIHITQGGTKVTSPYNVQYQVSMLIIKPTRCTNFSNLFLELNCTCFGQFLCPSSGIFHCTHSNGVCHTGLLTARKQQTCMAYTIAVCTVKNSWWWTEELSETCTV